MLELLQAFKQFLLRSMQPRPPRTLRPHRSPNIVVQDAGGEKSKQEVFYDVMIHRLDTQSNADDALSQKTATWLTIPTLVLTFLATILVVERESLMRWDYVAVLVAFILYVVSLAFLFAAYRPQAWADGPPWTQIAGDVGDAAVSTDEIYYNIGLHIAKDTIVENDKGLLRKKTLLNVGVFIGLCAIILMLAVVGLNLPRGTAKEPTRVIVVTPTPTPSPTPKPVPMATPVPSSTVLPTPTKSG